MAIEHGTPLVPVLSLGETMVTMEARESRRSEGGKEERRKEKERDFKLISPPLFFFPFLFFLILSLPFFSSSLFFPQLLENVHAPRMQAYTLRTIGVGFPIWPYGRWYSPLPNPHPVVVIFGEPIPVPLKEDPSIELIEQIHQVYYGQLQKMFAEHRHMIPGFDNCTLRFTEE